MYYYVKNLQGDIVKIVNKDGQVVASYEYNAWGEILSIKNYYGSNVTDSNHIALLNPFRYRGYVYDDETGLYYLQSRYYDPVTCRFLNADIYCDTLSITPLSTNMFAYCENNAIIKSDTKGKNCWWIQSESSAFEFGHTSLLIQEKPGYWWYFYWGPRSIQLIFLGTTTEKDINKKVERTINVYNKKYNLGIKYEENYNLSLRYSGDFTKSLNFIRTYMDNTKQRKYLLQFNPDIDNTQYNQLMK